MAISRNLHDGYDHSSVNLLLSILIRYPQISTLKFQQEDHTFRFTFMLKAEESIDSKRITSGIKKSLLAHCQLLGDQPERCLVELKKFSIYGRLEVIRDLASLSGAEISLLINLVQDAFGSRLIVENQEGLGDDVICQDEVISAFLEDLQDCPKGHTLYGMRENGHVLVFNHQDLELGR
jgi:hypothetical protein